MNKISVYIDGNNLYRSAIELGFKIDYKKFRGWLRQKYNASEVFIFIGLIPSNTDFYKSRFESCILITSDGDFGCLVEFFVDQKCMSEILVPDRHKCSILIKNKNVKITFLNDLYHKFSTLE